MSLLDIADRALAKVRGEPAPTEPTTLVVEPAAVYALPNPDVIRRRNRALAILADHPDQRLAVVAEPGDPAHITIAVRGAAVGDLEVAAERYDGIALLALMQQYGNA
jgi:hypothetical protein